MCADQSSFVGEDYSQVLMLLDEDDGAVPRLQGERLVLMFQQVGRWAGALFSSVQIVRAKKKPSSQLP